MRAIKMLLSALALVVAVQGSAHAQRAKSRPRARSAATKQKEDIRRLVGLTGVVEKELRSIDPILARIKEQTPQVPEKVWNEIKEEFKKEFSREQIVEMYAVIYENHFGAADVKGLIEFYESPVGKKLVAEMPIIEGEALLEGMRRGLSLGEKIREKLKAKGYDTPIT